MQSAHASTTTHAATATAGLPAEARYELLCAWCGVPFAFVFMAGFQLIAGFVPPPAPSLDAAAISAMYQEGATAIRLGTLLMMGASGLICPFTVAIFLAMRRIPGVAPALTYTQLVSGAIGVVFFVVPSLIWATCAFRPERDPELLLLLNDFGWILFLMPFTTFVIQNFALGFAILGDAGARPIFARWVGYFTLWVAVLFLPGGLLVFFKSGPFAWNGLFAFWIPLVVFFGWYMVMVWALRRAILAHARGA
jgi:hypothetical protein